MRHEVLVYQRRWRCEAGDAHGITESEAEGVDRGAEHLLEQGLVPEVQDAYAHER